LIIGRAAGGIKILIYLRKEEAMKVNVEIELTGDTSIGICEGDIPNRLERMFEIECFDREKWFRRALLKGMDNLLRSWEHMDKRRQKYLTHCRQADRS
jgi:hypothetical protein